MNRTRLRLAVLTATAVLALAPAGLGAATAHAAGAPARTAATATVNGTETIIQGNSGLTRGQSWSSPDGNTSLVQQTDGHVVLYHHGTAIWTARGTYGVGTYFYMQGDGNLVAYDAAWRPLWNSGTAGRPGAYLAVSNEGNLIVYSSASTPLWWSNFRPGGPVDPPDDCYPKPGRLCP
ncbi:hypothetical protein [Streptomyces sp. NPDC086023]|uniref:hypothetical protein n=1 Tax=Streptomyces sp. NPDC086023 TaxID=3365746 RepID=UPI0037CE7ACF